MQTSARDSQKKPARKAISFGSARSSLSSVSSTVTRSPRKSTQMKTTSRKSISTALPPKADCGTIPRLGCPCAFSASDAPKLRVVDPPRSHLRNRYCGGDDSDQGAPPADSQSPRTSGENGNGVGGSASQAGGAGVSGDRPQAEHDGAPAPEARASSDGRRDRQGKRTAAQSASKVGIAGPAPAKRPRERGAFFRRCFRPSHGNGLAFLDRCFRHSRWRRRCGLTLLLLLRFGGLALLSRQVCSSQLP